MDTIELLKSKGLKKTAQRIMLIDILQEKGIALTETDIKTEMGKLYHFLSHGPGSPSRRNHS